MLNAASHFHKALTANPGRLHMAAHSHHLWPDVTYAAHMQAWNDAATHADHKWDYIFDELIPAVQSHIARQLNLSKPERIAFAPNTHELVARLLSHFPHDTPIRILTTDSEFHSFSHQVQRMEESGRAHVTRIPTEPFHTFPERFVTAANQGSYDLLFFSQVFYNSGYAVPDICNMVHAIQDEKALIAIDSYHAFMTLPTDLHAIENRAFALAGGYKYAMSGEGACFMHCPDGFAPRPENTGWYARFAALGEQQSGRIAYGEGGARFWGSTFDPSGLYRFRAVQEWLQKEGITVDTIHTHVTALQKTLLKAFHNGQLASLNDATLLPEQESTPRGHFLTFQFPGARATYDRLVDKNVITDIRGDRLRIGLGLYHTAGDITQLLSHLQ